MALVFPGFNAAHQRSYECVNVRDEQALPPGAMGQQIHHLPLGPSEVLIHRPPALLIQGK